jgi:hypothetical protein
MGYGASATNGNFVRTPAVGAWRRQCLLPQLVPAKIRRKTTLLFRDEVGGVLSADQATKSPCPFQMVLRDRPF